MILVSRIRTRGPVWRGGRASDGSSGGQSACPQEAPRLNRVAGSSDFTGLGCNGSMDPCIHNRGREANIFQ